MLITKNYYNIKSANMKKKFLGLEIVFKTFILYMLSMFFQNS